MTTLLEKAMQFDTDKRPRYMPSDEELELAIAYADGKLSLAQVGAVLSEVGKSKQNASQWVGSTMLRAYRSGKLVIKREV